MAREVFYKDAMRRTGLRNVRWYQENLPHVLQTHRDKQVRGTTAAMALAQEFLQILDEPVHLPVGVEPRSVEPFEDDSLMMPIEPEVEALLYGTQKGAGEAYLRARNKKAPEDKFFFRVCTNWDYGWQQKQSRVRPRDVNRGRCAILRDTFYRKNNLKPDPPHYAQPAGGEVSICSEYQCTN